MPGTLLWFQYNFSIAVPIYLLWTQYWSYIKIHVVGTDWNVACWLPYLFVGILKVIDWQIHIFEIFSIYLSTMLFKYNCINIIIYIILFTFLIHILLFFLEVLNRKRFYKYNIQCINLKMAEDYQFKHNSYRILNTL